MSDHRIGIIGGSGLYDLEGFTNQNWQSVDTPFGKPSDEFLMGNLENREVVFLPRHGRGHRLMPAELNHRANIWAMKSLGVKWIISVSAVGSLQPQYHPCDIVLIDQFIDKTKQSQNHTFFGQGIVAHIAFAHPICEQLRQTLLKTAQEHQTPCHDGGSYVNMEGPAFSTKAESLMNHHAECAVIGMTNLGEAKCAREAEISYATMAMVTDYDAWNEDHDHVTVDQVIEYLHRNTTTARQLLSSVIPQIPTTANWPAHEALKNAVITQRDFWPQETIQKLGPILERYV